mgnify:CR=1 FL=1
MRFQKTTAEQLEQVMIIIRQAQAYLKEAGIDQWQNGYPNEDVILQDIKRGNSYVLQKQGQVLATAVLEFDGDPNYENIYEGQWLSDGPYGAIHRIAVEENHKGSNLASIMIQAMEGLCLERGVWSLRVDTHGDNEPMKRMLQKNGFQYCGVIFLADGSPRIALEKVLGQVSLPGQ